MRNISDTLFLEPEVLPNEIYKIIQDAEKFYVIDAALELDLFEKTKEPISAYELAKIIGTNPKLTEKICNILVAIGLLKKKENLYENSNIANMYLIKDSPYSQKNLLKLERSIVKNNWTKLIDALRNGFIEVKKDYSLREFSLAMAESAIRGELQQIVKILSQIEDMKKAKKLLDLGGGHGLYSIALAKIFPNLHVYILDFPQVIELVTREFVEKYANYERIHLIPADFTKDDIGNNYDIVFASHCLYGKNNQLLDILKKIHKSLNINGILISNHWYLDSNQEGPIRALLWELNLACFHFKDFDLFTLKEFISYLSKAGFLVEDIIDISNIDSPSKLVIARRI